jgi:hypothetical protein
MSRSALKRDSADGKPAPANEPWPPVKFGRRDKQTEEKPQTHPQEPRVGHLPGALRVSIARATETCQRKVQPASRLDLVC